VAVRVGRGCLKKSEMRVVNAVRFADSRGGCDIREDD